MAAHSTEGAPSPADSYSLVLFLLNISARPGYFYRNAVGGGSWFL